MRADFLLSPPFPFSWISPLISQIYLIYLIALLRLSEILASAFLAVCIKYDVYHVSLEMTNKEKENKRPLLISIWFDWQHLEMAEEVSLA